MSDVYADFLDLLSPAAGGIQAGGWLFGDVLLAGRGALQVACNTYDTGADNLLRAGDRLLVLVTADRQDYYVLQKAVFS